MERVKAAAERAEAQQETAPAAEPDAHGAAPPLGAAGLLGAQRESLARAIGLQHGNRHLSRLVAELQVARQSPAAPAATPLDQLRTLLEDEDVEGSITHMGTLGPVDVTAVLDSPAFRDLAVEAFGNNEMFRAVRAMNGNLRRSLEWMIEEGTDWDSVKTVIGAATS